LKTIIPNTIKKKKKKKKGIKENNNLFWRGYLLVGASEIKIQSSHFLKLYICIGIWNNSTSAIVEDNAVLVKY
jgi:hypothetical protein